MGFGDHRRATAIHFQDFLHLSAAFLRLLVVLLFRTRDPVPILTCHHSNNTIKLHSEQFQSTSRAIPEQFQSNFSFQSTFRAISEQFQLSEHFLSIFRAISAFRALSEQFLINFRPLSEQCKLSEQFQSNFSFQSTFRALSEHFQSNFRAL